MRNAVTVAIAIAVVPFGLARSEEREAIDQPQIKVERGARVLAAAAPVLRGNHRSIQVNVAPGGDNILGDAANEPSIAIDLGDPRRMAIVWRQFDTVDSNFRQAGYGYTTDGGRTWTAGVLDPGQFRSDPVLASDVHGTFFFYSLSQRLGPDVLSAELFRSTDGGATWVGPILGFGGDKNWIAVDATTTTPAGDTHVYAMWTSGTSCCGFDNFTRSTDGGDTFVGPLTTEVRPSWGTLDVGPAGELYMAGRESPHAIIRSTSALDAGRPPVFEFSTPITLGGFTTYADPSSPNPVGLLGQVWVAVDRSHGPRRGNVYVLGSVRPPGDPQDVMFIRSTDRGATWSAPLRIHDEPGGCFQWFGTLSVSPDGRLDAIWNESCFVAGVGYLAEVQYAYSTNGGAQWSTGLPVTPAWDPFVGYPNQSKIGDYYHMVSDERGGNLAYAATHRGGQDVYFLRVGDCNANGRHDGRDILAGTSVDCDADGIPDECEEETPCPTCDGDGVCEANEDCLSCPGDCSAAACGNGVCEPTFGEDCVSCASDCNGLQSGSPALRFCCGDGDGQNPTDCEDRRCTSGAFECIDTFVCCGDGTCDPGEVCSADCPAADPDGDGVLDALDCDPAGPAFATPGAVTDLQFLDDKTTLVWRAQASTAGLGVGYQVVRGRLDELPVGSGPSETCLALSASRTVDPEIPAVDAGRYYLVRASNACGDGGWGTDSANQPRATAACGP